MKFALHSFDTEGIMKNIGYVFGLLKGGSGRRILPVDPGRWFTRRPYEYCTLCRALVACVRLVSGVYLYLFESVAGVRTLGHKASER